MKYIFEVIDEAKKAKTKKAKLEVLKKNESWALKDILKGTLDPKIDWLIPKGEAPYTPNEGHNAPSNLLKQHKKFQYLVKGVPTYANMSTLKRERICIELLESIHPEDAELVVSMINKKPFGGGITPKLVNEAFPNLVSTT
jgi:hypothetical protein